MRNVRPVGVVAKLAAAVLFSAPAMAQQLVFPASTPVASAVPIQVTGLRPGDRVRLRTTVRDASGQVWVARAEFRADTRGRIDTSRDPAISGSYTGVETGGLFNQARAIADSTAPLRFVRGPRSYPRTIALEDAGGRVLDSLIVEHVIWGPGVSMTPVSANGFVGHLFLPALPNAPGIVVLGGSEGGFADDLAAQLASHGFAALSLAYFGADGLPSELREIPLDHMGRALDWLRNHPVVRGNKVALFGTSKGAEAALLVASHASDIAAVVAYAPSSVVWSCICRQAELSSWTYRGVPVPSIGPGTDPSYRPAQGEALRPAVHYSYRMRSAPDEASIAVERIAAPLLLIAGGDDQLWPSLPMAQAIMQRRAARTGHRDDVLLAYPEAGHLIGKAFLPAGSTRTAGGRLETGGSSAANARAQADSWPRVLAFLTRSLAR